MVLLRKIDYNLQVYLGIMMVLSVPILLYFGFLVGLFLLGVWQLLSAILNSNSFLNAGMAKQICNYWKFAGLIFAFFFLTYPLTLIFNEDDVQVLAGIGLVGSVPVAAYYTAIYRKLIGFIVLRSELGGVIKSNH